MSDIFLSYSNKDAIAARRVVDALLAAGYSVSWDQEIPTGADWNSWITSQLHAARICVVLWSNASVKSRSVAHEAAIALENHKLVPAVIDVLHPEDFPLGCYTIQAANLRGFHGGPHPGMMTLLDAIGAKIGRRPIISKEGVQPGVKRVQPATFERAPICAVRRKSTHIDTPSVWVRKQVELAAMTFAGCLAGYIILTGVNLGAAKKTAFEVVESLR
jgi:hypothetical protein